MQSNDFLLKVADASGFARDPGSRSGIEEPQAVPRHVGQELEDLQLTKWLRTRISSCRAGRTTILIRYDDYYPAQAQLVVQNLTNAIIKANTSASSTGRALYDSAWSSSPSTNSGCQKPRRNSRLSARVNVVSGSRQCRESGNEARPGVCGRRRTMSFSV